MQNTGIAFLQRDIAGSVLRLNLLRFWSIADHLVDPELALPLPIGGVEAFDRYVRYVLPLLRENGGDVVFLGVGGPFLIVLEDERWDRAMLVRQSSVASFLAFAEHDAYRAGLGQRIAALEDSRLLPLTELRLPT